MAPDKPGAALFAYHTGQRAESQQMRVLDIEAPYGTPGIEESQADHVDAPNVPETESSWSAREVPRRMRTLNHLEIFCPAGKMVQSAGVIWKGESIFCEEGIDTAAGLCYTVLCCKDLQQKKLSCPT